MDARTIRGLQPMLARFLKRFDNCFARKDTRAHLAVYVNGQLSDLPRKSAEPIVLHIASETTGSNPRVIPIEGKFSETFP